MPAGSRSISTHGPLARPGALTIKSKPCFYLHETRVERSPPTQEPPSLTSTLKLRNFSTSYAIAREAYSSSSLGGHYCASPGAGEPSEHPSCYSLYSPGVCLAFFNTKTTVGLCPHHSQPCTKPQHPILYNPATRRWTHKHSILPPTWQYTQTKLHITAVCLCTY